MTKPRSGLRNRHSEPGSIGRSTRQLCTMQRLRLICAAGRARGRGALVASRREAAESLKTALIASEVTGCNGWCVRSGRTGKALGDGSAFPIFGTTRWIHAKLRGMTGHAERNDRDRTQALGQVGFELRQMASASVRLARPRLADDSVAWNAYLESSCLHARVLIDFLVGTSRFTSDIRRTDFVPEWGPAPADATKRLNKNYPLLHKYLAHLTWERVSRSAPDWDYPSIAADVIDVADAWAEHLSLSERSLCEVFRPHVRSARQILDEDL